MHAGFRIQNRSRLGGVRVSEICLGTLVIILLSLAVLYQNRRLSNVDQVWERYRQKIKLPPSEVLKFVTLGYDQIYADWLWLQSIQQYGKGWITENNSTEPIFEYFDVLTDIDPQFVSAYRFGNLIIGDNRLDWENGQGLLRKGVYKNPDNYDIPYLGLYNAIWQTDDRIDAKWFAYQLRRNPNAPHFMKRLEEYIERKSGRYDAAFEINMRYLLEYLATGNEVEESIVRKRMRVSLDDWYRNELDDAAQRYIDLYGDHPMRMEDILTPDLRPDFRAPVPSLIQRSLDQYEVEISQIHGKEVPRALVDQVVEASYANVVGLPPEPLYQTWYFIHDGIRNDYVLNPQGFGRDPKHLPYIIAAGEMIKRINEHMVQFQRFVMEFKEENGRLPNDSEVDEYIIRDPLGGHFVYDRTDPVSPVYGTFQSTAARRIDQNREPRMGWSGPGPFPLPLQPSLKEHEVDLVWGIENGYIKEDGTEIWTVTKDTVNPEDPLGVKQFVRDLMP